jgi:hypothetical protein
VTLRLEIGNDLSVHADNAEDLVADVTYIKDHAGELADAITDIKQVFLAKGAFSAPAAAAPAAVNPPPAANNAPPSGTVPRCEHGEGKWATGTNKKTGQPYQGYYCPGRYPNQCKPSKLGN